MASTNEECELYLLHLSFVGHEVWVPLLYEPYTPHTYKKINASTLNGNFILKFI